MEETKLLSEMARTRRALQLSQRDLAHALGCTQSMVSRMEKGQVSPRLRMVLAYLQAMGCRLVIQQK